MSRVKHALRRTLAKNTFVAEVTVDACTSCGEMNVPAKTLVAFERAVTAEVARRGPVTGETFHWLRRHVGISIPELVTVLGKPPETIGAWEEGRRPLDRAAWLVLSTLVLEQLAEPSALRPRLAGLRTLSVGHRPLELTG
jgi:DNA-binding transcriptional regulator YiaG